MGVMDKSIFFIQTSNINFKHLTIQPMLVSSTDGAAGILINAPTTTTKENITNIIIININNSPTGSSMFTDNTIVVHDSTSPTIGPTFVVNDSARSLLVSQKMTADNTTSAP